MEPPEITLYFDIPMCLLLNSYISCQLSTKVNGHTASMKCGCHLQDLNVNFRNIILPETLKCLSSENPSVLAILAALDTILDDVCGAGGADSLLATLEGQLCAAIDGTGGVGGAGSAGGTGMEVGAAVWIPSSPVLLFNL